MKNNYKLLPTEDIRITKDSTTIGVFDKLNNTYTKTEIDRNFYTKTETDETVSEINGAISDCNDDITAISETLAVLDRIIFPEKYYLVLQAITNTAFHFYYNNLNGELYYSVDDGKTWNIFDSQEPTETIVPGQKILIRGNIVPIGGGGGTSTNGCGTIESTGQFKAYGNVMAIMYDITPTTVNHYTPVAGAFARLFENCTGLVDAGELIIPSTISDSCCQEMFKGCTSLENAPALPATEMEPYCYYQMFLGCTSLETAPDLPGDNLKTYSYFEMFKNCSSLNYVKALLTTPTVGNNWYTNMLTGVASNGTFVKKTDTPWVAGDGLVPSGWTVVDATA